MPKPPRPGRKPSRKAVVKLRFSPLERAFLQRAARATDRTFSAFVRDSALKLAVHFLNHAKHLPPGSVMITNSIILADTVTLLDVTREPRTSEELQEQFRSAAKQLDTALEAEKTS